jgi:hypothetical protein
MTKWLIWTLTLVALGAAAADLPGKWHFALETEGGPREVTATFELSGKQVSGRWQNADVKGTYDSGRLDLAFPVTSSEGGMTGTLKITGRMEGEALTGRWEFEGYSGTYRATRVK